jgi:Cof subfamily protein (haloacid dehalogenase superfamily)
MRYDILAVDIDGTLLNSDSAIPPRHAEALRAADAAGVRIVFASGRMIPATSCMAAEIGLRPAPTVGYNGGRVVDADGGVLFHQPVPAPLAAQLVERFIGLGLHINYYLDDKLYIDHQTEWGELYTGRTGSHMIEVGDLRQFAGREPTKVLVVAAIPRVLELFPPYHEEFGRELYVTITNPEYLEFMNLHVSKGTGLRCAAEALGVPRERVAAIGDAVNDASMVEWAGLGCAMGNGAESVRAVADVVAPSNDEDGLAWFVESHILA